MATAAAMGVMITMNDFNAWYSIFKEHKTNKSIQGYDLPHSRSEFCNEDKTAVYVNIADPNDAIIYVEDVDMPKMGATMGHEEFIKMTSDMNVQTKLNMLNNIGPDTADKPTMLIQLTVEDFDKWQAGFQAHATSKTGTWGYEVPCTREEMCDDSKTKIYRAAEGGNKIAICLVDVKMEVLGPAMESENFQKLEKDLGESPEKLVHVATEFVPPSE